MSWLGWFRSGKRVLAVGSVHLDTIALSSLPTTAVEDHYVGNITHSVGAAPTTWRQTSQANLLISRMFAKSPSIRSCQSIPC